jgi:hypothetical protein
MPLVSYLLDTSEGEDEHRRVGGVLPLDTVLATRDDRALRLWHHRLGHRNFRDIAALLNLTLPPQLPACHTCAAAKSRRHALTKRSTPLFEAPRAGHTLFWDHAGPFACLTWAGERYMSVKCDCYSGRLFVKMAESTGADAVVEEWSELALLFENHFGRRTVTYLITDDAPYFGNRQLGDFNKRHGIQHIQVPPHTQEQNGVAERTIGTLLGMTRAALHQSGLPDRSFGECVMAMAWTLNRTPHRAGSPLTRLEKWRGQLQPHQHDALRTWGCAAYLHLNHGARGHVGGPGPLAKLKPRAELCVMVGYEPNGLGYRVARLGNWSVYTSAHVTFNEEFFPCVTSYVDQRDFLTPQQQRVIAHMPAAAEATDPSEPRRSQRSREPSGSALRNVPDRDIAPEADDVSVAIDQLDDAYPLLLSYATQSASDPLPNYYFLITEGSERAEWQAALQHELAQHRKFNTLGPPLPADSLPPGVKPIPLDVIAKRKRNGKAKARAIIKGYHMREGVDYNATFSPVPCLGALRLFFALAALLGLLIDQADCHTAFLAPDMDTDVWVVVPNWFSIEGAAAAAGHTIQKLLKSVPGIPQGPRLWNRHLRKAFAKVRLVQSKAEACLFYCLQRGLYLFIWVDDLFLFYAHEAKPAAAKLWRDLRLVLDMDDPEPVQDCLGCNITRPHDNVVRLSQSAAIKRLLTKLNLQDCKPLSTPLTPGLKLTKKDCPDAQAATAMASEQRWYRSVVASLLYFVNWTRPDLAYAVSKLCRYMHNPGQPHMAALKHTLRYLSGTADLGLTYDFSNGWRHRAHKKAYAGVHGFYDSAHADCVDTFRSTMGYIFFLGPCPFSWNSKLHTVITTSTNHSEYCASARASREAKWIHEFARELGLTKFTEPIELYSDSQGAIAVSYYPVHRGSTKHFDLADHYTREQQELGVTSISFVDTHAMVADIMTKALGNAAFSQHCALLVSTFATGPTPSSVTT